MPIRPENRDLYPKDWPEIRVEILARAGERRGPGPITYHIKAEARCEFCGAANHRVRPGRPGEPGPQVVLTIAHLDHDPTNNGLAGDRPNLKALCQRCHNRWDAPHRKETRARTRAAKELAAGQGFMRFEET